MLTEADGFYFQSGSAELSEAFRDKLRRTIMDRIAELARVYKVDLVEVVGHTDEVPLRGQVSDLDESLLPFLRGGKASMTAADNVGLGMARAASVVKTLLEDGRLAHLTLVPYSAGQVILTTNRLSQGNARYAQKERRRIEIRLRRSVW
jgi:flagellar motor protein MotB